MRLTRSTVKLCGGQKAKLDCVSPRRNRRALNVSLMVSSIAAPCARPFFLDVRVPGSGSSSQSARGRCTMGLREGRTSQGGRRTPLGSAGHTIKRDDPAHVPAGTSGQPSQANAVARCGLSGHAGGPVKELAGPQHRVHHHRELSGDGGPLKADPLLA